MNKTSCISCGVSGCTCKTSGSKSSLLTRVRAPLVMTVACIASPCCSPILVPVLIALLAGTPLATWAAANLGAVYGGLTALSVLGLLMAWRWLRGSSARQVLA